MEAVLSAVTPLNSYLCFVPVQKGLSLRQVASNREKSTTLDFIKPSARTSRPDDQSREQPQCADCERNSSWLARSLAFSFSYLVSASTGGLASGGGISSIDSRIESTERNSDWPGTRTSVQETEDMELLPQQFYGEDRNPVVHPP